MPSSIQSIISQFWFGQWSDIIYQKITTRWTHQGMWCCNGICHFEKKNIVSVILHIKCGDACPRGIQRNKIILICSARLNDKLSWCTHKGFSMKLNKFGTFDNNIKSVISKLNVVYMSNNVAFRYRNHVFALSNSVISFIRRIMRWINQLVIYGDRRLKGRYVLLDKHNFLHNLRHIIYQNQYCVKKLR